MTIRKLISPVRILEYTRKKECWTKEYVNKKGDTVPAKKKPMEAWISLNLNVWQAVCTVPHRKHRAKDIYTALMKEQCQGVYPVPKGIQIKIIYTMFQQSRRLTDVANVCSVVDKLACDAMMHWGTLPEDNWTVIPMVGYRYGGVDKLNPRVEIEIFDLGIATDNRHQTHFIFDDDEGPF